MENKYFAELARRLKEDGISTGETGGSHLPVLLHGEAVMNVMQGGAVFLMPEASGNREADTLYYKVSGSAEFVREYTSAMEQAPLLRAVGLDQSDGYRLLADYNGVVLAGQELGHDRGYQFVTWRRSPDRTGLAHGDYYWNDFAGAKLSFAGRSGLVAPSQLYSQDQSRAVYRLVRRQLEEGVLECQERGLLEEVKRKIEDHCPEAESMYQIERLAGDPRTGYTLVRGGRRTPCAVGWFDEASGTYLSTPDPHDFPNAQPFEGPYDSLVGLCLANLPIIEAIPEWNYPLVLFELTDAEALLEQVKTREGYNFGFIMGDLAFVTDQSDMDHWLLAKRENGGWQALDHIPLYEILARHGDEDFKQWTAGLQSCSAADYPEQLKMPESATPAREGPTM